MSVEEYLLCQLAGCKPYAHFLLRVMMAEAREQPNKTDWRIENLREELGMKAETLRKHLSALEKCGVLKRCSQKNAARGRPWVSYQLSALVLSQVQSQPEARHGELLRRLFSGEVMSLADLVSQKRHRALKAEINRPPVGDVATQKLSTESRLLFACLLSEADQFGVVQIGTADLAAYTGMSKPALKAGIGKLKLLGLIRRQVSGVPSDIFKKGKVSSTYFLNLDALGGGLRVAIGIYEGANVRSFGLLVFKDAITASRGQKCHGGTPHYFARRLAKQPSDARARVAWICQLELLRFAAGMLGRHWEMLALSEVDARVFEVELELIRARLSDNLSELGKGSKDEFQVLCEFFCSHATELARALRLSFGETDWVSVPRDFCILPTVPVLGDYERELTLMWCPCPAGWENVAVFRSDRPGVRDIRISEANMCIDERHRVGLIDCKPAMLDRLVRAVGAKEKKKLAEAKASQAAVQAGQNGLERRNPVNDSQEPAHEDHPSEGSH